MARGFLLFVLAGAVVVGSLNSAAAETCFHVRLKSEMTASGIDDQGVRDLTTACRDDCEDQAQPRLEAKRLAGKIATQSAPHQNVTIAALGAVEPGESATFFMNNVADGYPSLRVTSRVKAICACAVG